MQRPPSEVSRDKGPITLLIARTAGARTSDARMSDVAIAREQDTKCPYSDSSDTI